jgi:hypothetical protein
LDLDKGTIEFYLNGKNQGIAYTNVIGPLSPAITFYSSLDDIDYLTNAIEPNGLSVSTASVSPLVKNSKFGNKFVLEQYPGVILSNGNLNVKYGESTNSQIRTVFASNKFTTGKHYWEFKIINTSVPSNIMIGVCDSTAMSTTSTFLSQ